MWVEVQELGRKLLACKPAEGGCPIPSKRLLALGRQISATHHEPHQSGQFPALLFAHLCVPRHGGTYGRVSVDPALGKRGEQTIYL